MSVLHIHHLIRLTFDFGMKSTNLNLIPWVGKQVLLGSELKNSHTKPQPQPLGYIVLLLCALGSINSAHLHGSVSGDQLKIPTSIFECLYCTFSFAIARPWFTLIPRAVLRVLNKYWDQFNYFAIYIIHVGLSTSPVISQKFNVCFKFVRTPRFKVEIY